MEAAADARAEREELAEKQARVEKALAIQRVRALLTQRRAPVSDSSTEDELSDSDESSGACLEGSEVTKSNVTGKSVKEREKTMPPSAIAESHSESLSPAAQLFCSGADDEANKSHGASDNFNERSSPMEIDYRGRQVRWEFCWVPGRVSCARSESTSGVEKSRGMHRGRLRVESSGQAGYYAALSIALLMSGTDEAAESKIISTEGKVRTNRGVSHINSLDKNGNYPSVQFVVLVEKYNNILL
jgi:hypothetical protein